ncbi:MAG: twin-arginine translocase subunit TatC [Opitutaceae bacterium]|nr:twin-arginine translocase subunit TatC [Verrucomicrobiales bacterium]
MANDAEDPRPDLFDAEGEGGPIKSFLEHLEDLRWTMIKSAAAIAVGMVICLIAGNLLVELLKWPLHRAEKLRVNHRQMGSLKIGTNQINSFPIVGNEIGGLNVGSNRHVVFQLTPMQVGTSSFLAFQISTNAPGEEELGQPVKLLNFSPVGGFMVALHVALYGGILLASPFIIYFLGQFILPALKIHEKKYILRGFAIGTLLFMVGVAFCYFVLMHIALRASVQYSEWLGFSADNWRAEEYIGFVCKFMLGMGLGFELPVVLLVLVKIGILNYARLAAMRRYMIVINLILGALLTTPEVITQVMMAIPLQILYEISVWIAWYWERKARKRSDEAASLPHD